MSQTAEYKLEKKGVNNKVLCKKIIDFIDEGFRNSEIIWSNDSDRQAMIDILDEHLEYEYADRDMIDQWNVICDFRNNTIAEMDNGIYTLEVAYRQKNCLNTTRLIYTVKDLLISSIREQLDFTLLP